ncbi:M20/M25/M40 family metallo-hydrolase [Acanthopleuribacter pedis]|uniref:M20/M25/M40 family metallo-hydrolase n=1 Tax=Acanthopleuribacter pedis TaxID=442870 RepID=A0A8J7U5H8_9BACT|nr:M20/M25/M40 family metallo-hydrolase [Acanthopleuribacter pedis]MBO1320458.1 M20/M25/M40 family metallo-hydrolase [Acanthopleuribacter pedis]
MNPSRFTLIRILLCCCLTAPFWVSAEEPIPQTSAKQLKTWVDELAGDAMEGRKEGTPGAKRAAEWLANEFKTLGLKPLPGAEGYFQSFDFTFQKQELSARNVMAMLEGSDPKLKDEWIMLSAHYDHVGTKPEGEGDLIFNGADDNASGVAVCLAVGEVLAKMKKEGRGPKRSVVIIGWAAEELGLFGSGHFAKNPLLPLEKMVVNLNFEMVGHTKKLGKKKLWLTGGPYSDLHKIVIAKAKDAGWEYVDAPFPKLNLFVRSDNIRFAMLESDREKRTAVGIPAHSFSTWGGGEHYHQVHDNPEHLDIENMTELAGIMTAITRQVADQKAWIQWLENDFYSFSRYKGKTAEAAND